MNARRRLKIFLSIWLFGLLAALPVSADAAEIYSLDPVHSSVVFRVKHLGVAYVYGRFNGPTGSFVFDEASPDKSAIDVRVNAEDVDTAVEKRDEHLRSPDFFNSGEYRFISFKSTSVKKLDNATYEVSGSLTLLGTSRPLMVTAKETGSGNDQGGNFRRGFETSFRIERSEFGMDYMINTVGDEVEVTVSVEGIRQ